MMPRSDVLKGACHVAMDGKEELRSYATCA